MSATKNATVSTPGQVIKRAMDEKGLSRTELTRILGSSGRVSDLLNDKREPSLREIKMLREILGIKADDLIPTPEAAVIDEPDWAKFPLAEMAKRGWIDSVERRKESAKEQLSKLAERTGALSGFMGNIVYRRNVIQGSRQSDPYNMLARVMGVRLMAQNVDAQPL